MDIVAAFSTYGSCVEREAELREGVQGAVKDLEKTSYAISTTLEKIHNTQGIQVCVGGRSFMHLLFAVMDKVFF